MDKNRLANLLLLLEKSPDDAFLLYAVGFEYESNEDFQAALPYYERLLKTHPAYLPVYYQLGLLYQKTGNLNKAKEILDKGLALANQRHHRILTTRQQPSNQLPGDQK